MPATLASSRKRSSAPARRAGGRTAAAPRATLRIAVVGGAGHVGLPLSLVLATHGFPVTIIDHDRRKIEALKQKRLPFLEEGAQPLLDALAAPALAFSSSHQDVATADVIILTVGTPLDDHLNPDLTQVYGAIEQIRPSLRDGQVLVLRSTLFPGTSEKIQERLRALGLKVGVSFCPERIAQGKAIKELGELPQLISASDARTLAIVRRVFSAFNREVIELGMVEAELAKLFTNAWRYIKFAVANQFYMTATEKGLDFYRIRDAMMRRYERVADFPAAGFAAGPCLLKDTMQLAAYNRQHFAVGHAAMLLNETLPDFLVEQVKRRRALSGARVGILGMAFKADNDDHRESLAYKLRKLLEYEGATVLCSDPYIADPSFVPAAQALRCDVVFIGCPHTAYRQLSFEGRDVVDCWGLTRQGRAA
ncbi:MAG: nucleotide sugar dehydrogenase [Candidatus Omnitrophica bacterium]|nr:nucleotide sugar dehydrogenase [Candidatus Omnitrophota bacterium]